ncbi:MAG: hypothetical protein VX195_10405, partial [Pseudomonadota bacterium]|nr:hypothetical protein [Pseudomonadota bacterium]
YEPDEPSELFYRLNQPTRLTPGEQRNAFYGPAREQLKELVGIFERLGNERETIGFSNSRLAYDDIIARILFFCERRTFAVKSTETVISARFKDKEPFDSKTYENVRFAIERFSEARSFAGSVRLNKATAISWLLFYARYRGDDSDLRYFQWFIDTMSSASEDARIQNAVELFKDRASLRVTDVSSVVLRDFCLWYVFHIASGGRVATLPNGTRDWLMQIESLFSPNTFLTEFEFENMIANNVPSDEWAMFQ